MAKYYKVHTPMDADTLSAEVQLFTLVEYPEDVKEGFGEVGEVLSVVTYSTGERVSFPDYYLDQLVDDGYIGVPTSFIQLPDSIGLEAKGESTPLEVKP